MPHKMILALLVCIFSDSYCDEDKGILEKLKNKANDSVYVLYFMKEPDSFTGDDSTAGLYVWDFEHHIKDVLDSVKRSESIWVQKWIHRQSWKHLNPTDTILYGIHYKGGLLFASGSGMRDMDVAEKMLASGIKLNSKWRSLVKESRKVRTSETRK